MTEFPISPLSLDPLTFDYWGSFDAAIIAQLAPLAENDCYQPKIYRAPAVPAEVVKANGYVSYGLKITPGSIIYGFYLPPSGPLTALPAQFNVQIKDQSLKHEWFDQPVPSYFLANSKLTYLSVGQNVVGCFPCLLDAPYPVVGNGLFLVQIWETSGSQQRIELPLGVLEAIGAACL
jgi:hypothetical protein